MTRQRTDVLFVNPPFSRLPMDYDDNASLSRFEMDAMNPGILSMAAYLRSMGFTYRIIDLYRTKQWTQIRKVIETALEEANPRIVGVSNLTAYDYLDTLAICRLVKELRPDVCTLVGGQHATGLGIEVLRGCHAVDAVAIGQGEVTLVEVAGRSKRGLPLRDIAGLAVREGNSLVPPSCQARTVSLDEIPPLDFDEYPNARSYTPFVEEGRGCHMQCDFCNNPAFFGRTYFRRGIERWEREISNALQYFGPDASYAVLTSNFGFRGAEEKLAALERNGIRWATQMSCDLPWERLVHRFGDAGMFMLNMGVESGSPVVLRRMNKARDPSKYLESARRILEAVHNDGRFESRINIIIYASETPQTVEQTVSWLRSVSSVLNAVICCVAISYPGSVLWSQLPELQMQHGTRPLRSEYCIATHHYPLHPSSSLNYQQSTRLCLQIEEEFSPTRLFTVRHNYRTYDAVLPS